jgi:hypothetical protein
MGRRAIAAEKVAEVLRVYTETRSLRKTAKQCGVSKTLVQNAAKRRHHSQRSTPPAPNTGRPLSVGAREIAAIKRTVAATGNRREAARLLGLGREVVRKAARGDMDDRCDAHHERPILNPGEVYVVAQNCGQGHWVEVLPCRLCLLEAARVRDFLARRHEYQGYVAAWNAGLPRRVASGERPSEPVALDLQLGPEEQARFEEVRRRRSHDGPVLNSNPDGG